MALGPLSRPTMLPARSLRLILLLVLLGPLWVLGGPAQAEMVAPPSLQGEMLFAAEFGSQTNGQIDIEADCVFNEAGSATITYAARGPAFGPYPGTYVERGTIQAETLVPGPYESGVVVDWTATFTIDSPIGQVSGRKTLATGPFSTYFECLRNNGPFGGPSLIETVFAGAGRLQYEATIRTADGTFTDRGDANGQVRESCVLPCTTKSASFFENFYLSTGVLPLDPAGKATGGGQVTASTAGSAGVTVGFTVRAQSDGRLGGRCNIVDGSANVHVLCLTVTDYQQVGNTATWRGVAEVEGVRESYTITVTDNGEPNSGTDTFTYTSESYAVIGNVTHGNVQVHTSPPTLP